MPTTVKIAFVCWSVTLLVVLGAALVVTLSVAGSAFVGLGAMINVFVWVALLRPFGQGRQWARLLLSALATAETIALAYVVVTALELVDQLSTAGVLILTVAVLAAVGLVLGLALAWATGSRHHFRHAPPTPGSRISVPT